MIHVLGWHWTRNQTSWWVTIDCFIALIIRRWELNKSVSFSFLFLLYAYCCRCMKLPDLIVEVCSIGLMTVKCVQPLTQGLSTQQTFLFISKLLLSFHRLHFWSTKNHIQVVSFYIKGAIDCMLQLLNIKNWTVQMS
jgi:hypothetical protein